MAVPNHFELPNEVKFGSVTQFVSAQFIVFAGDQFLTRFQPSKSTN
jgi:hypothetical protein